MAFDRERAAPAQLDQEFLMRRLEPKCTALVAIDFQNDFCAPGGFYDTIGHDLSMGQSAARRTSDLLPIARAAGLLIVLVRCDYSKPFVSDTMREWQEHSGFPPQYCVSGSWGAEFYEIAPAPGDIVVTKHRYSAFVDTDLQAVLRARRIQNLLFAGVATNVCVESTARDAFMFDYRVTVLSDCTGTYSERLHEATLENIRRAFGVVSTSEEVIGIWSNMHAEAARSPVAG